MLTQEQIGEVLEYKPESGLFIWKERQDTGPKARTWNTRYGGRRAGDMDSRGYLRICIFGKRYAAHRLAWMVGHRQWPSKGMDIDHVDGVKTNNRLENLRICTRSQNLQNSRGKSKCGLPKGVHRNGHGYAAHIYANKKQIHIGQYKTIREAKAAYNAAAKIIFGEFARP